VVLVPIDAAPEVLALCEARVAKEIVTEDELRAGAGAAEVYARHEAF
jgi:hypothetical protein